MVTQEQENLEIFVGRTLEQELYKSVLKGEKDYWLVFLTGIPGIGKTSLLRQLKKQKLETTAVIEVDFQNVEADHHGEIDGQYTQSESNLLTDPLRLLEALADGARDYCDEMHYTLFKNILLREREDIESFSEQIKQLEQEIADPEQLAQIRQSLLSAQQEMQRNSWEIVGGSFYTLIDTLERKKQQIVLMLDTCERLLEPEGLRVGQWLMNTLLPGLHDRIVQQDKICLAVIASRVPLASLIIPQQEQYPNPLSFFTEEEVNEYLEEAGLRKKMDKSTFQRILKMTRGHPLSLALICSLWQELEDEQPTGGEGEESDEFQNSDEFQSMIAGRISDKFVEERILKRLPSPDKKLTEYVALLRSSFNLPQLQVIFSDLLPESLSDSEVSEIFERFINYPYVVRQRGYRFSFHEYIREVLAIHTKKQHPEKWKIYHKKAFDFFPPYSLEWYYHFIAFNEAEGMGAWKKAIEQARTDGKSANIGSLLQVAGDKTLDLTPQSRTLLLEEEELFYRDNGQMQKAEESHGQIERIKQEERERERASDQKATGTGDREKSGRKGRSGLLPALSGWKPPQVPAFIRPGPKVAATEGGEIVERRERRGRLPVLRRLPRVVDFVIIGVLLVVVLGFVLYNTLYQKSAPAAMGIGVLPVAGEPIGLSDGSFTFDAHCKTDKSLECQAADKFKQHDIARAEILWNRALMVDKGDAETRIYLADQAVAKAPHVVTFVVATTLTGPNASLGQGDLQGAYLAQQYYNESLKLPNGYKVRLLIANLGSHADNAVQVANQIVQEAKSDPTIAGVVGFPLSGYVSQAMSILQNAHLPLISSGASSDVLKGNFPSFFSIVSPDAAQAQAAADYATQTLHARSAALFYDPNDASNNDLAMHFEQDFRQPGGQIYPETYTTGQAKSLEAGLTNMEGKAPDLLYFAGSASDLNTVLKNSASDNIPVLGSDRLYQLQDYSVSISASKLYFTGFAYPGEWSKLCNSGSLSAQLARQACFNNAFFTVYSFVFNNMQANGESIVSYDALSVLLSAYQYVLSHHLGLQAALQAITDQQAIAGVSGLTAFNGHGNAVNKAIMILSFDSQKGISLVPGSKVPPVCSLVQCKP